MQLTSFAKQAKIAKGIRVQVLHRQVILILRVCLSIGCFLLGCATHDQRDPPPVDTPYYPGAINQLNNQLIVVSRNGNDRFSNGNVLFVDLNQVDRSLQKFPATTDVMLRQVIGPGLVTGSVLSPTLGIAPALSSDQALFVLGGEKNQLVKIPLANGNPNCAPNPIGNPLLGQQCLAPNSVLQLNATNPFFLILTSGVSNLSNQDSGLIAFKFSPEYRARQPGKEDAYAGELQTFIWPKSQTAPPQVVNTYSLARLVRNTDQNSIVDKVLVSDLKISNNYVFAAFQTAKAIDPAISTADPYAFIVWFPLSELQNPSGIDSTKVRFLNLTLTYGAKFVAGLDVVNAGNGLIKLIAITQAPNGILQVHIPSLGGNGQAFVYQSQSTCADPVDVRLLPGSSRIFVACFDGRGKIAEYALDTLMQTREHTGFGRGPFQMWFDTRPGTSRLYVSYYLEGTVGVFDVSPRLSPLGRIFQTSAPNQEGGQG